MRVRRVIRDIWGMYLKGSTVLHRKEVFVSIGIKQREIEEFAVECALNTRKYMWDLRPENGGEL
jgi:hypothetical protein